MFLCFRLSVTDDKMASAGKSPNELFTCGICTEPYDDDTHKAKFLACYHTFCSHCLSQWHRKQGQPNTSSIQCPNCNQLTDVPEIGVAGLQTNFYIESVKEISAKSDEPKTGENIEGCHKHGKQPMFFFCQTCDMAMCHHCTVIDNKETDGHTLVTSGDVVAAHRHTPEGQLQTRHTSWTLIKMAVQQVESKVKEIHADRDSAIKDIETLIHNAKCQLDRCQEEATDAILLHHATQHSKLLGKQRQLQQVTQLLQKRVRQSKQILGTGDINGVADSTEQLENAAGVTLDFTLFDQINNYFSSSLTTEPNSLHEKLCNIGQMCLQSLSPTNVVFRSGEITAGFKSPITVELFNDAGNKAPFVAHFVTVQITNPQQEELPVTLSTTHPECTVAFTPQTSGRHGITVLYLGQKLTSKQTHITVNSNNPVLKFGKRGFGNGTFMSPRAVKIDNDNCLYVADTGNMLIQKFNADGEFLRQFQVNVNGTHYSIFDMVLDQDNGLITCTELLINEKYASSLQGDTVLVFNLKGELQHEYTNNEMELPENITLNSRGDVIVSDRTTNSLFKYDKRGKFITELANSENLKSPSYLCTREDDSMLLSDTSNHCIRILNPEGETVRRIGSKGKENGQLFCPFGIATDGENILVADSGNKRIQVFKPDGTFVSMIESESDPLSNPRGLAVTQDGFVFVADRDHHCIKKYRYKDFHQ